ncbi:MAG: class I SAM-dependent methyltransferase [Alphaproteobacteria bacterium]|nr:class I SAM-dependent methyltransferase [Alphaproteobacteria bacterium]
MVWLNPHSDPSAAASDLGHAMTARATRDERARQGFVTAARAHMYGSIARALKTTYECKVKPAFRARKRLDPKTDLEVHRALKQETVFKFYSRYRNIVQGLVYRSVIPGIERDLPALIARAKALSQDTTRAEGTLTLNPRLKVPRYTGGLDVHLMPGNYHTDHVADDVAQGAIYEHGWLVFIRGIIGHLDGITDGISKYVRARYPDFRPARILDLGCTTGIHTLPWKATFPEADVHGVDVAAPCLRFGHARAQSRGIAVHYHQMDGSATTFPDASFDLVTSCMVLHEMPMDRVRALLQDARRLLRPGGLMLHYELPPSTYMDPYSDFFLNWDSCYNKEPFYRAFRAADPMKECRDAGFARGDYVQFVVPSTHHFGADAPAAVLNQTAADTPTLLQKYLGGVRWFCFGAWRSA